MSEIELLIEPVKYLVTAVPGERHFALYVEWRGRGWAITDGAMCADADGNWEYESIPDEWLARFRFRTSEEAMEVAKRLARTWTVMGTDVEAARRMVAERIADGIDQPWRFR